MRRRRRFGLALVVAAVAAGGAACQAAPNPSAAAAAAAAGQTAPAADLAAIRETIDAVNAAAGGTVDDQQAQLTARVEPDRRAEVQRCPTATTTVRLAPVDRGLRAVPGSTAPAPTAPAPTATEPTAPPDTTTYMLPTLIRIFTGDRLTGTDLTTLRVVVYHDANGSEAYLTPFCVN